MSLLPLSFAADTVPLILSLVAIAVILYLCYALSRFLAKKAGSAANSANIQILERVAITPDKGLCVARICGRYCLLAYSNERVEILRELGPEELQNPDAGEKRDFMDVLNSALKGRLDLTRNDRGHKIDRK